MDHPKWFYLTTIFINAVIVFQTAIMGLALYRFW